MKRKFIIDKEVNLKESDFLQTKTYSDNLKRVIENTEDNKVFTIGLFGSWGSGKSSIIETASKEFDQKKVKFINYDAWQYANDSFRRMFLRRVRKELGLDETELMKKFYENESTDIGNKYQLSTTRLLWILGGVLLAIALIWVFPFEFDLKMPIYSMLTLIGLFITILSGAFHQLKISITKPLFFAPEQFESCFKEMVSTSLKKYKWHEKVVFTIAGDKAVRNLEKLVIVIDNIDRCNNDVAYQLLTDIKTFLASDNYSIVFVIPVDDEALRKHLFRLNNHNDEDISVKEKEEFLRKFFNVIIRIKPYLETDMFSFAKNVNEKYKLGFKMDTLNLAAKEYSTNPRRVIQLFNNLISELSNYPEDFASKNETLICAIIILREEFSSYYKEVVNSPKIFLEDIELSTNDPKRERIERYNRITRSIKSNVSVSQLTHILTNSNSIFTDLPADLRDSIESFDLTNVLLAIKNDSNRVFDYIIHKSRFCLQNSLSNDLVSYFDMVANLSSQIDIDRAINSRLTDIFEVKSEYIIERTSNFDCLCKYAIMLEAQSLHRLKRGIIDKVINSNNGQDFWPKLFNSAVRNFQDKETSIKMASTFSTNYKVINTEMLFSKNQYLYLINNDFVESRINEIENWSTSASNYKILIDVFAKKENLSHSSVNKLLEKISQIAGDSFNKTRDQIFEIIDYVNSFLNSLQDGVLENNFSDLEILYEKLKVRKVAHANYPNSRNHDTQVDLILESLNQDENLNKCLELLKNIYRVTNGKLYIVDSINKLTEKRSEVNAILKELTEKGIILSSVHEFILDDDKYDDLLTRVLLKHVFEIKEGNEFLVTTERATEKLDSILIFANEKKSNEVYQLIEDLIKIDFYKEIVLNCVISKPTNFINSLPSSILKLALNSFDSKSYLEFSNNYSFLEVVATGGTQVQINFLTKILNQKIDLNKDISMVISIASKIRNSKPSDKNLLKMHLESFKENYFESMDESDKKNLNNLIKQLS
ncbi:KAP family P-loop NTPase fold protein [Lacibacter sp.]|uniref:KAP family P-loop NTPase fold protein n=1 Tax=Lacibacter sp. TaxID=1915409 RepID=UPI002B4B3B66|nr:P-loop NTPase fold protein [Lacibacter sp.]HLP36951.1 P-loop NTPase fold protein [Lacibacter sp.]